MLFSRNTPAAEPDALTQGLNDAELDACTEILSTLSQDLGFDAAAVFTRLRAGQPLVQAMGFSGDTIDLLYAQAVARFNAQDISTALPLFQGLTSLAPDVRDHWLGLGICLRLKEEPDLARVAFVTAIQLAPDTPAPWFHNCELACRQKNWKEAREMEQKFLALPYTPEKARLTSDLGRLSALIKTHAGS